MHLALIAAKSGGGKSLKIILIIELFKTFSWEPALVWGRNQYPNVKSIGKLFSDISLAL